jgi:hypothetical protein
VSIKDECKGSKIRTVLKINIATKNSSIQCIYYV